VTIGVKGLFFLCVGIHVVTPLVFLTRTTQNPYSVQIVILQCALLIAWGGVGIQLWRKRAISMVHTVLDVPLVLFGFWTLISWGLSYWSHGLFFRSGIFHEGLRGAIFVWVNALGAFFISTQFSRGARSVILRKLMLTVGGISAAYGLLQYFGHDPLWGNSVNAFSGRPISTYGNPNFLSSVLVLFLPLLFQHCVTARTTGRAWGWGIMGFLYAAALTCTMTRSSWLGAGLAVALYLILDRTTVVGVYKRASFFMCSVFSLVLFWPASTLGSSVPMARMAELWRGVTGEQVYASWHQRLLIWRSAWDMWAESPWVGKGWGLFELFFPYYQGRLIPLELFRTFRTHANNAHQLFLEVGSQTGLIGLGLFFWLIVLTVITHRKSSERLSRDERSLAAALLAGMGGMAADNALGNVSLFFAVPGFLFFWVWGQWAGLSSGENHTPDRLSESFTPTEGVATLIKGGAARRLGAVLLLTLCLLGVPLLARNFLGEVAFFSGSQFAQAKNDRAGEELFLRARKWKRFDVNTNFELGNLYSQRAETARAHGYQSELKANAEKAVIAYTDALRSNPSYEELFESRARAFRSLGRDKESALDLRMAVLINPLRKESILALDTLFSRSHASGSIRIDALDRAVEIFPKDLHFRFQRAVALEAEGKNLEAAQAYEGVLSLDLENAGAWDGLLRVGSALPARGIEGRKLLASIREGARLSKWKEAHALAEQLIEWFPDYPLARLMSADMAAHAGDDASAIVRYREFLLRVPDHAEARRNLDTVMKRHTPHPSSPHAIDDRNVLR
jgi:O-antigen ligase/tetratricopeptide (TPR) repeat protein